MFFSRDDTAAGSVLHDTGNNEIEFRKAVRAILLTPDADVLMIEIRDPDNGWRGWIMPGGGIEDGEALEDCLRREIEEETGLKNAVIGPQVWTRLHTFDWTSRMLTQSELFFLVKTDRFEPDMTVNPDPFEQSFTQRMRWWNLEEIESSDEVFVPRKLAVYLRQIVETGPPDKPFNCGV